jgi:AraC family transcriptional regulator of adaptative response / DNA-3-methyladenine glycosylase II
MAAAAAPPWTDPDACTSTSEFVHRLGAKCAKMRSMSPTINGVRTTGIYCRDGCTAKPLSRNVTPFSSPVAAEAAGFRPCLRCRPDRLPPLVDGDSDALVGRALLLIADGALDEASEDALGKRLGVSARHLRRLFHERVGATPAFVARSRRAHFARRLLDETDLPMFDVAFTSGFASVRQMNRVMRSVFHFTPTELREKRRRTDRLVADGGIRLRIPHHGPLAFADVLAYLRPRAIPGVEVIDDGVYRRTITACGEPGVIEVSPADDGRHLVVVAHLPTLGALIDDVARCRRLFGLDRPAAADTPLARDPILGDAVRARPGLRVPGAWDPFETAVRVMLGQQVSVAGATTLAGRLVQELGSAVPGLGRMGLSHLFPPAARVADAGLDRLQRVGMPAARAHAIGEFARAYAEERVRLDPAARLEDTVRALEALPGIGPWTAQLIALRACGQPDAFPGGDLGLRRSAARLVGAPAALSQIDLDRIAEAWSPHRALAAMHLWRVS